MANLNIKFTLINSKFTGQECPLCYQLLFKSKQVDFVNSVNKNMIISPYFLLKFTLMAHYETVSPLTKHSLMVLKGIVSPLGSTKIYIVGT